MGPETLSHVLRLLPLPADPRLLVGPHTSDDAAVYQLSEEEALIATVDFFTPVVDDPYTFGQIAAANALSDVYAMGGRPLLGLNLVGFPTCLPVEVLTEILRGGADKVREAGAILAGGHTVQDEEPKYGLAVVGVAHPRRLWRNSTAREGDALILTKPLGTGVINTAAKAEMAPPEAATAAAATMRSLNAAAAAALQEVEVHACTDVTGFGLLGHAAEMAEASGVTLRLQAGAVPFLPGARDLALLGMFPAGAYANRHWWEERVRSEVEETDLLLLCDPQTSGGLLAAVPARQAERALAELAARGTPGFVIGEAVARERYLIQLIP